MGGEHRNVAKGHAKVGIQAGEVRGSVHISGDLNQADGSLDAKAILHEIADLRSAIFAAQQNFVITAEAGATAQSDLDVACTFVTEAAAGKRGNLLTSLKRLEIPLAGAVDLLTKLATIMQAIKGAR
jgi:adenosylhomocysteine nucleosidase